MRRRPRMFGMFAFVSAPIDTPILTVSILPLARSLDINRLGGKGITALAAILNETKITHLRCAAIPVAFAFVSAPIDTPILSHRAHPAPCSQSRKQWDRRRGSLRARRHSQGDDDLQPQVCRRPRVFAFVSAPIDMPTLSPFPSCPSLAQFLQQWHRSQGRLCARCHPQGDADHRPEVRRPPSVRFYVNAHFTRLYSLSPFTSCPSLAVSDTTTLELRAPLRSPPSSRRRRSLTSSAPLPHSVRFRVSAR